MTGMQPSDGVLFFTLNSADKILERIVEFRVTSDIFIIPIEDP